MPCKVEQESYLNSYEVAREKVAEENPTFTPREIRMRTAQLFRPYYRRIAATSEVEKKGGEEYENGEFTITPEGKMYFPREGQYAEDFSLNQKRLSELHGNPDEYSLSDHQTSLLIQKAFAEGATTVVTTFGSRDIIEYRYDPVTKTGKIRVHNTAVNEKLHSHREMQDIAKGKFAGLTETAPAGNVFVLTDVKLAVGVAVATVATVGYAARRTAGEIRQTARSVIHYIEERKTKKEGPLPPKKKGETAPARPDPKATDVTAAHTKKPSPPEQAKKPALLKKIAEQVIFRHPSERTVRRKEKTIRKKTIDVQARPKREPATQTLRRRAPHRETAVRTMPREHRRMPRKEAKTIRQKETRRTVLFAETVRVAGKRRVKETARRGIRAETVRKTIRELIPVLVRRLGVLRRTEHAAPVPEIRQRAAMERRTTRVILAFLLWYVLGDPKFARRASVPGRKTEEATLSHQEPRAWILGAIIWELSMLREGGKAVPVKKKKKKQKAHALPPQGLIFAYAT